MDACVERYVPKVAQLPSLKQNPSVFVWAGEEHPQTPVLHSWGAHVTITETAVPQVVRDHLVGKVDVEGWVGLLVDAKALDLFELEANGRDVELGGEETLEHFIRAQLAQHDSWAVSFLPGWEQLDEVSEGDVDRVVSVLKSSLNWSLNPHGFIIWHVG